MEHKEQSKQPETVTENVDNVNEQEYIEGPEPAKEETEVSPDEADLSRSE
jgi:hypothetical protein